VSFCPTRSSLRFAWSASSVIPHPTSHIPIPHPLAAIPASLSLSSHCRCVTSVTSIASDTLWRLASGLPPVDGKEESLSCPSHLGASVLKARHLRRTHFSISLWIPSRGEPHSVGQFDQSSQQGTCSLFVSNRVESSISSLETTSGTAMAHESPERLRKLVDSPLLRVSRPVSACSRCECLDDVLLPKLTHSPRPLRKSQSEPQSMPLRGQYHFLPNFLY